MGQTVTRDRRVKCQLGATRSPSPHLFHLRSRCARTPPQRSDLLSRQPDPATHTGCSASFSSPASSPSPPPLSRRRQRPLKAAPLASPWVVGPRCPPMKPPTAARRFHADHRHALRRPQGPLWGYTVGSRAPDAAVASGTTKSEQGEWAKKFNKFFGKKEARPTLACPHHVQQPPASLKLPAFSALPPARSAPPAAIAPPRRLARAPSAAQAPEPPAKKGSRLKRPGTI